MVKVRVVLARAPGRRRIDLFQVSDNGCTEGLQAVRIQTVKAGFSLGRRLPVIVVAPQPLRETPVAPLRVHRFAVLRRTQHQAGVAHHPHERVVDVGSAGEWMGGGAQRLTHVHHRGRAAALEVACAAAPRPGKWAEGAEVEADGWAARAAWAKISVTSWSVVCEKS